MCVCILYTYVQFYRNLIFNVFTVDWPSAKFSFLKFHLQNFLLASIGEQDTHEQLCLHLIGIMVCNLDYTSCSFVEVRDERL